jgi:ABC-2 type transport system permease protein
MNVLPVIKKEFRQIRRDKRALGILVFLPAFLLVLVGYALNFDVKHLSLAIFDEDRSSTSREFVQSLTHSEYFDLNYTLTSEREIDAMLNSGKAHLVLRVPRDFSRNLLSGKNATVQILLDGSNNNTASVAGGYTAAAIQHYNARISGELLARQGKSFSPPISLEPKVFYNPDLKSAKFLVPGLFGLILMIVTVISTSLSVVREKELGTMEQLQTSPLKSYEIILGKALPYLLIGLVAATIILLCGWILFDVTVRGNIFMLYTAILVFMLAGLGQGLLISSVADTQQIAFFLSVFSSLLPSFLLSGFIFPISSMPVVLQIISNVQAAKFFLVIVRSIILKGTDLFAVWDQVAYLLVFVAVTIGVSSVRLQRDLNA